MSFGQSISTCFRKFVTFRGRAPRSEYWYFVLFGVLIGIPAGIIDGALSVANHGATTGRPVTGLVSLVLFLPRLSVAVRRLHDVNRSGWNIGGFFIFFTVYAGVLIGWIVSLHDAAPNFMGPLGIAVILGAVVAFGWAIYLFVLSVMKGTGGPNRFGNDPLGANADVFN